MCRSKNSLNPIVLHTAYSRISNEKRRQARRFTLTGCRLVEVPVPTRSRSLFAGSVRIPSESIRGPPGGLVFGMRTNGKAGAGLRRWCTGGKRPPGRPSLASPGVVITCCSSAPESPDAAACSEVPTFRYEPAPGPAEQEMAEHGTSVHCP